MSGIQALVRLLIEQRRLDASRGLNTGVFISGYPGSPLGGLDREIVRAREHLEPHGVVFEPGVNEELAATAVNGTQLVEQLPGRTRDGVTGFWYGKAPGLDRAADAIRHGNVSGTAHLGGAVALIGDDPICKSSTLPSSCELMAESLMLPLLSPGGVSDIVRLGLHAVALSRAAGPVDGDEDRLRRRRRGRVGGARRSGRRNPAAPRGQPRRPADAARGQLGGRRARPDGRPPRRRARVRASAPASTGSSSSPASPAARWSPRDRHSPRCCGRSRSWASASPSWRSWGSGSCAWSSCGRCTPTTCARSPTGVQELIVVEDKRPFVERQLRDLLYGTLGAPPVLGKRDGDGPAADRAGGNGRRRRGGAGAGAPLGVRRCPDAVRDRGRTRRRCASAGPPPSPLPMARTPFFCSGCPHNLSTRAAEDQLVGVGIGCHALILVDSSQQRGQLLGSPQMGGEGAQWNGMAPFTTDRHYVQNIGDGTFHHSGSLAIRGAVAAGVNITFRLLYNDAIAMTGGQAATGRLGVVELTHWLATEGVKRVIVTTEDPGELAGATLPRDRHRPPPRRASPRLRRSWRPSTASPC